MTKSVTDSQSVRERLDVLSTMLAAGLLRLQSRKSSPNLPVESDSLLDYEGSIGGDVAGDLEVSRP
jgi:hypothetical protein